VGLVQKNGRSSIALRFSATSSREMKVTIGYGSARRIIRRGPGNTAPIVLSAKEVGAGPTAILISVQSGGRSRSYILFTPTAARLGEIAPESPRATYAGASAKKVLSDLAALTGLVILAEKPLDKTFVGEMSPGTPVSALEGVSADLGLKVQPQGKAIYLLTAAQ
jgi:hypothetical protein